MVGGTTGAVRLHEQRKRHHNAFALDSRRLRERPGTTQFRTPRPGEGAGGTRASVPRRTIVPRIALRRDPKSGLDPRTCPVSPPRRAPPDNAGAPRQRPAVQVDRRPAGRVRGQPPSPRTDKRRPQEARPRPCPRPDLAEQVQPHCGPRRRGCAARSRRARLSPCGQDCGRSRFRSPRSAARPSAWECEVRPDRGRAGQQP